MGKERSFLQKFIWFYLDSVLMLAITVKSGFYESFCWLADSFWLTNDCIWSTSFCATTTLTSCSTATRRSPIRASGKDLKQYKACCLSKTIWNSGVSKHFREFRKHNFCSLFSFFDVVTNVVTCFTKLSPLIKLICTRIMLLLGLIFWRLKICSAQKRWA